MKPRVQLFVVGSVVLFFCTLMPYQLLSVGRAMLTVILICLSSAIILFRSENYEWSGGVKSIFIALLPWLLAALLLVNGAFDRSIEVPHQTKVIESDIWQCCDVVTVESWRPGRKEETVYIFEIFGRFRFFFKGQALSVGIKSGALGMPWIGSVSRIDDRPSS